MDDDAPPTDDDAPPTLRKPDRTPPAAPVDAAPTTSSPADAGLEPNVWR